MCVLCFCLANKPFFMLSITWSKSLTATAHISPMKLVDKMKLQNVNSKSVRYTYIRNLRVRLSSSKSEHASCFSPIAICLRIEWGTHTYSLSLSPIAKWNLSSMDVVQSILASIICMSIVRIVVCAIRIRFLYLRKFVQCVCESYLIVVVVVAVVVIVIFMHCRFTADCCVLCAYRVTALAGNPLLFHTVWKQIQFQ